MIYPRELRKADVPSLNTREYWLYHHTESEYPKHTEFGGKWLLFCTKETVDKTWTVIKDLQDKELLGNISKVSTSYSAKTNSYVICVYTYDSRDENDVMRVRDNLKKAGFDTPIPYKRDIETKKGIYGSGNEFLLRV